MHPIYHLTPPQHLIIVPRLISKLEACKAKLEESYDKFATHLTEYQLDEMQKLDAKNPKLTELLWSQLLNAWQHLEILFPQERVCAFFKSFHLKGYFGPKFNLKLCDPPMSLQPHGKRG